MNEKKDLYDFKMFMKVNDTNILVFRAWIADEKTYYFREVENFGIDDSYKETFLSIIDGSLSLKYYEENEEEIAISTISVSGETVFEKIDSAKGILDELFGLDISYEQLELSDMLKFRFDGHDLNIDYGLDIKNASKLYEVSNSLISTMAANNTDFTGIMQVGAFGGSTVIPYVSESIDYNALEVIRKVITDINNKSIDGTFANGTAKYASLYKNFIKRLSEIKRIPELETFEILIGDETLSIDDLSLISNAQAQLYTETVSHIGIVYSLNNYLRSQRNIYSVNVIVDDREMILHLNSELENFENMLRILKENIDKKIEFSGYRTSEIVVDVTNLSRYYEELRTTTD